MMRNSVDCVAERTVLAFNESKSEKESTRRLAETAPRIAAAAEAPVMDGWQAQYTSCTSTANAKENGKMARSFPQNNWAGFTGESCRSSRELRSLSPAKLSAASGAAIGAMRHPSKSIM